jgi:hypothetical protein
MVGHLSNISGGLQVVNLEHLLRVFKNRVLRRMFGPRRDEVTGEWR